MARAALLMLAASLLLIGATLALAVHTDSQARQIVVLGDSLATLRAEVDEHRAAYIHLQTLYVDAYERADSLGREVAVCRLPERDRAALTRLLDALPAVLAAWLQGRQ